MHVPPGSGVLDEAPPGARRPASPDALVERPDAVDHVAPVAAGALGLAHEVAEPAHEIGEVGAERHVGGIQPDRLALAVDRGDQAAPRKRDRAAAMAARCKRDPGVDHAEAGAEDEHGGVRIDRRVGLRTGADRDVLADDRVLLVADSKHRDMTDQAGAVGKPARRRRPPWWRRRRIPRRRCATGRSGPPPAAVRRARWRGSRHRRGAARRFFAGSFRAPGLAASATARNARDRWHRRSCRTR